MDSPLPVIDWLQTPPNFIIHLLRVAVLGFVSAFTFGLQNLLCHQMKQMQPCPWEETLHYCFRSFHGYMGTSHSILISPYSASSLTIFSRSQLRPVPSCGPTRRYQDDWPLPLNPMPQNRPTAFSVFYWQCGNANLCKVVRISERTTSSGEPNRS